MDIRFSKRDRAGSSSGIISMALGTERCIFDFRNAITRVRIVEFVGSGTKNAEASRFN